MKTLAASLSILTREGVMLYLLRGVAFTCIISVLGVIMGLIVGSLLALARTYCKKGPARILGWFAAAYIELFRNTPYCVDKSILAIYKTEGRSYIDAEFSPQEYGVATKKGSDFSTLCDDLVKGWLADGTIEQLIKDNGLD